MKMSPAQLCGSRRTTRARGRPLKFARNARRIRRSSSRGGAPISMTWRTVKGCRARVAFLSSRKRRRWSRAHSKLAPTRFFSYISLV